MELILILILILCNGLLSMAEMAIIASKKSKIQQLHQEGVKNADKVLHMIENPNTLFSTIQVGITLIGTFAGALGAVAFSSGFADVLKIIGFSVALSNSLAVAIVVFLITYFTIIIGELVPKRIGLSNPESISRWMALPMELLSILFRPLISILSTTTEGVLTTLNITPRKELPVGLEEIRILMQQGTRNGVFRSTEKNIVEKTLDLSDKKVASVMTARNKIVFIDVDSDINALKKAVLENQFSYYPVCKGSLDNIQGVINSDALLGAFIAHQKINIKDLMYKPLLIPENIKALQVMELFKRHHIHMGIVIDEYGNVQGIVTVTDILEAIVGDLPEIHDKEEKQIIRRNQNSWLVDGLLSTAEMKNYFKIQGLPEEKEAGYNTVGGFVMHILGRVPVSGDVISIPGYKIEVMDMDINRVDKIMLIKQPDIHKTT